MIRLKFKHKPIFTGGNVTLYFYQIKKIREHNREVAENWIWILAVALTALVAWAVLK